MENINQNKKLSEHEGIKERSNYLRGTIKKELANETTGALNSEDSYLLKFHGSYQQSDRDLDSERKKQKLEPLYSFLLRIRVPAGVATPQQWIAVDDLAGTLANPTIKLTTRQAFELHGIFKRNLYQTIHDVNKVALDTIAACGDVNRNVMCNPNPWQSPVHEEVTEYAREISRRFTPQTKAYHELWVNDELVGGGEPTEDTEPVYGKTYLPRKFKIAIAIPPYNDTDIFTNDIAIIAIEKNGVLQGFNVAAGGGMGMTFGAGNTYPRLASMFGYTPKEKLLDVCEHIIGIQRDYGNRVERPLARLKYTIDRLGLDNVIAELNNRLGWKLEPAREFNFVDNNDEYGWKKGINGKWNYTMFVEGGRVRDTDKLKLKTVLRKIAEIHDGDFRLTGNQNVIIANISEQKKLTIYRLLYDHNILENNNQTGLRLHSLACVALNLCGLAFAEAERYLPSLIDKLDEAVRLNGLEKQSINIRMTGCPNGCARPFAAEIGLVGRTLGRYNLYLGGGHAGDRLNVLYKDMVNEEEILAALNPILAQYSKERNENERFGDFVVRKGIIKHTGKPSDYQKL